MNKMGLKYCFICLVLFGFVITAYGGMYSWTDKNKATGAELKRRETVLNSLSDKDDKTQIIKKLGNPSFSSPVHSFKYGPYVSVTEEWLYNNYLGDNRVLVIVIRRNRFKKYYFK